MLKESRAYVVELLNILNSSCDWRVVGRVTNDMDAILESGDIDVMVSPNGLRSFGLRIKAWAIKFDVVLVRVYSDEPGQWHCVFISASLDGVVRVVNLDVNTGYFRGGLRLMSSDDFLARDSGLGNIANFVYYLHKSTSKTNALESPKLEWLISQCEHISNINPELASRSLCFGRIRALGVLHAHKELLNYYEGRAASLPCLVNAPGGWPFAMRVRRCCRKLTNPLGCRVISHLNNEHNLELLKTYKSVFRMVRVYPDSFMGRVFSRLSVYRSGFVILFSECGLAKHVSPSFLREVHKRLVRRLLVKCKKTTPYWYPMEKE